MAVLVIKYNFRCRLAGVYILEECTVGIVLLLLDRCPKPEKALRHVLFGSFQNVDQSVSYLALSSFNASLLLHSRSRLGFVVFRKKSDGRAHGSSSPRS